MAKAVDCSVKQRKGRGLHGHEGVQAPSKAQKEGQDDSEKLTCRQLQQNHISPHFPIAVCLYVCLFVVNGCLFVAAGEPWGMAD